MSQLRSSSLLALVLVSAIVVIMLFSRVMSPQQVLGSRPECELDNDYGVIFVAFSPNGKYLAVAGDRSITLWDAFSMRKLGRLHNHSNSIACLAFSSVGDCFATGGWDNTVQVYSTSTLSIQTTLACSHVICGLAFNPGGKMLATVGYDQYARVWDLDTLAVTSKFRGHSVQLDGVDLPIQCVTFSPNGALLATGGADKNVKIWEVSTKSELITLPGEMGLIESLSFSSDGKLLAAGDCYGRIRIWEVESFKEKFEFHDRLAKASCIAFSPVDSRLLALGGNASSGCAVKIVNILTGNDVANFRMNNDSPKAIVHSLSFSPDGRLLAVGDGNRRVGIFQVPTTQ